MGTQSHGSVTQQIARLPKFFILGIFVYKEVLASKT